MRGTGTHQGSTAAMVHRGRVLDVDMASYSLVVATEFTKKVLSGVSFATPYQHFVGGEGIYFMPEVGSLVWLCEPSDGSMPFVLAWAAGQVEGDFRARKRDLNPGDIFLGTRDDNFLILRRGGILQMGGGPLSQRMFLPVNNTIKDICENYSLHTLGGDLEWAVKRSEQDTDGKRPTNLLLSGRQFASDKNPLAFLEIGSHDGDDDTIVSLLIKESAEDGAATKIGLKLTKSGDVQWDVKNDVSWSANNFSVSTEKDFKVSAKGSATIEATGSFSAKGASATMEAATGIATMKSPAQNVLDAPITLAGAGATMPVALAPPLLTWLAAHTHNIIVPVPGSPTTPPVLPSPPPPTIVSTSLLAK